MSSKSYANIGTGYNYLDKTANVANKVRYMLDRVLSMFQYENLPETIPQRELELQLFTNGYSVIAEVDGKLYAFKAGQGGTPDVYNNPTKAIISNPALNYSKELELGKECVLCRNDSMEQGLLPLFASYCSRMNDNEITMFLSDINGRLNRILTASDTATKESCELFLKQVMDGKQGVIMQRELLKSLEVYPEQKTSSTITQLIEYHQYLKASLYNEIGLNANYNMKRERLTTSEVNMNVSCLYPLIDDMLKNRQQAVEEINSMYGTDITVALAGVWARENPIEEQEQEEEDTGAGGQDDLDLEEKPETDTETDTETDAETGAETPAETEKKDEAEKVAEEQEAM